jgi:hypothetical protein
MIIPRRAKTLIINLYRPLNRKKKAHNLQMVNHLRPRRALRSLLPRLISLISLRLPLELISKNLPHKNNILLQN